MTPHNFLVLHGGGGPATVASLTAHLTKSFTVNAPTHPGWDGTERPESLDSVAALADFYAAYLGREGLNDVVVVGSSVGGWLAAELALRDSAHRIAGLILINSGGVDVPGETIMNVSGMTPQQLAGFSFHDASKLPARPAPTPEGLAVMAANAAALNAYAGDPYMHDPTLLGRLPGLTVPTLVIWGKSDRIFTVEYGRALAAAISGSRFDTIPAAGHLPWIEQPAAVFASIDEFMASAWPTD
ncbi:MAG: putative hydrolase [Microbacteriaceae bacterium]|nr:putative hydrolase [Microbacteriaceae bacterium]